MRKFDTLLFDLDGTLADPADGFTRCIAHAFEVVGLPRLPRKQIEDRIGPPLEDTFRVLGARSDQVEPLVSAYRDRYRETGIFENTIYPDVTDTLAGLRNEDYELHIATSKPTVFAETILDHFGIRSFFTHVFGSNLDGSLTHKRDILNAAQKKVGFDVSRTAMIGDRRFDIEAAREIGIHAVGVEWGYGDRSELISAGAETLVAFPRDLAAALR